MTKNKPLDDAFSFCRDIVAHDDPDRYLASLFAPRAARPAIWALLAFSQEVARVRDNVTDPNLGYIRLQWVREQIEGIYKGLSSRATRRGDPGPSSMITAEDPGSSRRDIRDDSIVGGGPVYTALRDVIQTYDLPRLAFDALIDAREFDLGTRGPQTMQEMVDYADRTTTPLVELCLRVCLSSPRGRGSGQKDVLDSRLRGNDNVKNIAIAYALVGLVRACDYHQDTRGWHMIPPEETVQTVTQAARRYLSTDPVTLDPMTRAMAAIADIHARRIEKMRFDMANPMLMIPPPFLALRVWARVRGVAFLKGSRYVLSSLMLTGSRPSSG